MSEKLYKALKEGRIKPQDLNDEGKKAVKEYIQGKVNRSLPESQRPVAMPRPIGKPKPQVRTQGMGNLKQVERAKPAPKMYERGQDKTQPLGRGDALLSGMMTGAFFGAGSDQVRKEIPEHSGWVTAGEIAGSLGPGAALYKGAAKVTKPIANKTGRILATGALAGAPFGAGRAGIEGVSQGKPTGDILKDVATQGAIYGGLGAAADLGIQKVVAPLAKKGIDKLFPKIDGQQAMDDINRAYSPRVKEPKFTDGSGDKLLKEMELAKREFGLDWTDLNSKQKSKIRQLMVSERLFSNKALPPTQGFELQGEPLRFKTQVPKGMEKQPIELPNPQKQLALPPAQNFQMQGEPVRFKRTIELPRVNPIQQAQEQVSATLPSPGMRVSQGDLNAGVTRTIRSQIDRSPKPKRRFAETLQNIRTQFVDDLAPLERLEKSVKGEVASAERSLYKQARLYRGSPEKAHNIIKTRLGPVISSIEDKGYSYADLGDYALAVHARDVMADGKQTGFMAKEIENTLKKFGTPEMEQARQQLVKLSTDMLNELADAGVITKDTVKVLREKWPNYMPFFRSFDDDKVEFAAGMSKSLANVSSPIKKLEGSNRKVIDPLESMVKNVFQAVNAADRNKVAIQLANLADSDTTGQFVRMLKDSEDVGRKNVVSVLKDGKKVRYEVQPDVYKAILDLDKESADLFIKIMSKPASVLRAGATLTPEFSFRNPMRDIVQAFITSKSGFNPVTDFSVGLFNAIGRGKKIKVGGREYTAGNLYEKFLRENGGYGNIISMDRELHRNVLENTLKKPLSRQIVDIVNPKQWLNVLRAIADVGETATKIGEFRAALRSGATPAEAAYRARDVMDFSRSGYSVRNLNRMVAFLNANIQGKSKLIRAAKENPVGVAAKSVATITLPSVGIFMAQKTLANERQQTLINDAPQWLRDTFWLIPIPGSDQIARIPKPFDLAPIFANIPERLLQYVYDNDKEAFDGFAKQALSSYSFPVMMTGLTPFVEGMANYSFFRQGPIIPAREQGLNYSDQYDINTTETAKFIAGGINKVTGGEGAFKNLGSPRVIDNTIRGLTAGLGTYATSAIDTIVEGITDMDKPEKPQKDISQMPLARAFLVNQNSTGKAMDKVYKEKDKLTRQKNSAKLTGEPFRRGGDLMYLDRMTDAIGDLTKAIKSIENNPTLDAATKRERIESLNERRNELARKAYNKLKEKR